MLEKRLRIGFSPVMLKVDTNSNFKKVLDILKCQNLIVPTPFKVSRILYGDVSQLVRGPDLCFSSLKVKLLMQVQDLSKTPNREVECSSHSIPTNGSKFK